ncbi:phosphoribosylamine--glycine ligase [Chamaesiphon minutus]|uniref:Phosphoribosylamine--glycine ligase n=1 Tax=Chamaesiphon minutus (strain ATCC 27169 / PCC 6605) TaxID=1173020 RepID=K9UC38_CHAP6|nr:phosphoribosylamine--glycine ligase [Chamaesiphon minutus]AFY92001.1 phosphoribosylamine--glycine ligase [Chamaesiphon minutus PCC 6605]
MKILVVGNGGREHAIAWALLQSPQVTQVLCVPGNGGTATMDRCQNLSFRSDDFGGIARFAEVNGVALIVIGPEFPLSIGIVDYLNNRNIPVFGPTRAGAQIESSKTWAKALMEDANIPTPKSATFTDLTTARAYIEQQGAPIVVKADGLAGGKGVIVAETLAEALTAVELLFAQNYGRLLIEEYVTGQEVSVIALTDGKTVRALLPAQDHKRIGDGDTGANTGGMGAYAPAPLATPALMLRVQNEVLDPTLAALKRKGIDYRGVLYAGLMISPSGEPKVLEFNCRFGDPETQAILPLLATPLVDLLLACTEQRLAALPPIEWKPAVATCVTIAAQGYPGNYERGKVISGIDMATNEGTLVFHAGTQLKQNRVVTDGGRVLSVTCIAPDFASSIDRVYQGVKAINFEGMYYRQDIAQRALS